MSDKAMDVGGASEITCHRKGNVIQKREREKIFTQVK